MYDLKVAVTIKGRCNAVGGHLHATKNSCLPVRSTTTKTAIDVQVLQYHQLHYLGCLIFGANFFYIIQYITKISLKTSFFDRSSISKFYFPWCISISCNYVSAMAHCLIDVFAVFQLPPFALNLDVFCHLLHNWTNSLPAVCKSGRHRQCRITSRPSVGFTADFPKLFACRTFNAPCHPSQHCITLERPSYFLVFMYG